MLSKAGRRVYIVKRPSVSANRAREVVLAPILEAELYQPNSRPQIPHAISNWHLDLSKLQPNNSIGHLLYFLHSRSWVPVPLDDIRKGLFHAREVDQPTYEYRNDDSCA
jgi:hypothetical protein